MQSGPPAAVPGANIGAAIYQELEQSDPVSGCGTIICPGRAHENRLLIFVDRLNVGAGLQQSLDGFHRIVTDDRHQDTFA